MNIAIYLRKSREDEELEHKEDTLNKHKQALLDYAHKNKLNIVKIYEELVSGSSIVNRPEMLKLLADIENNLYDAVLCMDLQRLGRGDMEEQGLILKTFKRSQTKIITPDKSYDLNNEFDEEYSEFEAFMSRKEYKMIVKRMQRGVIRSVKEGNYMSPVAPFGYKIENLKNGRTLIPDPEQSKIIKMIFDDYINNIGSALIARKLNSLGVKTLRNSNWTHDTILRIIRNEIYIGKIRWGKRKSDRTTRVKSDWIVVDGKHEGIIENDIWNKAQVILDNKYKPPKSANKKLNNAFAGLIYCAICGKGMIYKPYTKVESHLICRYGCENKSSKYIYVEKQILSNLRDTLTKLRLEINEEKKKSNINPYEDILKGLNKELRELEKQRNNLHDLLETGVYSVDIFLERNNKLNEKIEKVNAAIKNAEEEIKKNKSMDKVEIANRIHDLLENYDKLTNESRNEILKLIIKKVIYRKTKKQYNDQFDIEVYL